MDTKLKINQHSRVFGITFSMILIAMISVCVVTSYSFVYKNTKKWLDREHENAATQKDEDIRYYKRDFIEKLYKSNYVLFISSRQQSTISQKPSDIFLDEDGQQSRESERYDGNYESFVNQFNEMINDWYNYFYGVTVDEFSSFNYCFIDSNTGNTLTNSIASLPLLAQDTDEAQKAKDSYKFYIVFKYLEDGSLEISDYAGIEQEFIDEYKLLELTKSEILGRYDNEWHQHKNRLKSPSNATIIYASNAEEFYRSNKIHHSQSEPEYIFSQAGLLYVFLIAIGCVFLLAVILPFKKSWGIGSGLSSRIPLELSLLGLSFAFGMYGSVLRMAWATVSGDVLNEPEFAMISERALKILDYGVNFAVWMLTLTVIFITLLSIRQVFTIGLKRYFKEKTLTGRLLVWIYRKTKKIIRSLGEIDLSDSSNKYIIKVLALNFVILFVLCSVWVVGIFLLAVYSVILFFIIRSRVDDVKRKHAILLNGTSKIAEGNLEHTIEEDLGIFNPLKDELTKIQDGFKKAVEEELKSQRMKTDLITNVSHDLKTPLTAIITYVNLLKEENVSDEERKSYIETLDKKSQRLKRLIEDLFEVSKASSNNITIHPVDVDLVDLIKQVLLELDDKIAESKVEFRFNTGEDKLVLSLDSEKTYRIFENLIINIVKYAMPNTRAYIDIARRGDSVQITLKNISASELDFNTEEIGERFVRGDKSRNTEGSGLGLAIARSFVELQGGTFKIETDGDLFKAVIEWGIRTISD